MKNKLDLLVITCYTLTAAAELVLAAEGNIWPIRLLCAFGFGYLALKQYRKRAARTQV